jgi:DNA gyrase subunit B
MVKRASEGLVLRYGEGAAKLDGPALTKFITTLNDYLGFFDKVDKRLRDERITSLLPKLELAKRADFEGEQKTPPKKLADLEKKLNKLAKEAALKSVSLQFEAEHSLWEVTFVDSNGAERKINWELVSAPEYRQMMAKYKQIDQYMQPPFVIETAAKPAASKAETNGDAEPAAEGANGEAAPTPAKTAKRRSEPQTYETNSVRELFQHVLDEGRKDFTVQRYKGLGEMTAEQLWQTTMDPDKRTLLSVKAEDIEACETIFTTLMGEDVESRRKFIEENALDVKNLDI